MSLYRFIASDNPLPEIDQSGFIRMKVRDLKKMIPVPRSPLPLASWDELDENTEVLYAESEEDTGGLHISICDNPPFGLERYITKAYVYWLGGRFHSKCVDQLHHYIQTNIREEDRVELWSIWFGDNPEAKLCKTIVLSELTVADLELLRSHWHCCIMIE
ncbi:hypothetical protein GTO91_10170 [Heliobacterium undosum]|uniref:Uncharacterized protein n=1 Tax=Heliomicrobium undosum TaxID=121734 RepID=A0A845LAX2_9FIRM|nr:hypothetical protein [Heliomicrobium undosum]MZP30071.1 hypothetical protein [Heliomicrobium undosum]